MVHHSSQSGPHLKSLQKHPAVNEITQKSDDHIVLKISLDNEHLPPEITHHLLDWGFTMTWLNSTDKLITLEFKRGDALEQERANLEQNELVSYPNN